MNSFGRIFILTSYGESHGIAIGGVIDGCPAGLKIDELTGVISGTPTAATYKENVVYTVRMDEEDNPQIWLVSLTLTINPKAPETTTTTTTIAPVIAKKTIVCTKGTLTKRVTALNPKCPTGYKKKK